MSKKSHGTSDKPVQEKLRWECDVKNADKICNFNRHYAEFAGYWNTKTTFLEEEVRANANANANATPNPNPNPNPNPYPNPNR